MLDKLFSLEDPSLATTASFNLICRVKWSPDVFRLDSCLKKDIYSKIKYSIKQSEGSFANTSAILFLFHCQAFVTVKHLSLSSICHCQAFDWVNVAKEVFIYSYLKSH